MKLNVGYFDQTVEVSKGVCPPYKRVDIEVKEVCPHCGIKIKIEKNRLDKNIFATEDSLIHRKCYTPYILSKIFKEKGYYKGEQNGKRKNCND